jgi:hypothetical protein
MVWAGSARVVEFIQHGSALMDGPPWLGLGLGMILSLHCKGGAFVFKVWPYLALACWPEGLLVGKPPLVV